MCRFLALEGGSVPPALINLGPDDAQVACDIPLNSISEGTECFVKDGVIQFISAESKEPVAAGKISAKIKNAILLFVAKPNAAKAKWDIFVIDDSPKSFPIAGAYVANFYNQNIRFIIGGERIMLPSGGHHGLGRPTKLDPFNMAPVIFQFQKDEAWITASETMLRFTPGIRYMIFTYVDPMSGRPRAATYQDYKRTDASPAQ